MPSYCFRHGKWVSEDSYKEITDPVILNDLKNNRKSKFIAVKKNKVIWHSQRGVSPIEYFDKSDYRFTVKEDEPLIVLFSKQECVKRISLASFKSIVNKEIIKDYGENYDDIVYVVDSLKEYIPDVLNFISGPAALAYELQCKN